jgi:hypothetical protein
MKIELIKETRFNGDVVFSIERDGLYVSNTLMMWKPTSDLPYADAEAEAIKMYEQVKQLDGNIKKEVIKFEEI